MKKFLFSITVLATCLQLHAQSWSLTGNSGTTPGTNFLGTKDSKTLVFKVNNQWSGYIDYLNTKANTSFGYQAAKNNKGTENSAFGYKAYFSNTSGNYNLAAGTYALYSNTTGQYNTAVGDQALYSNQIGWENTAVGKGSLFSNTGFYNTATGYAALNANADGDYNTANGVSALLRNTTGSYNTSLGADAMYYNTAGICNTAAGSYTLFSNTGNYNTGVGYYALKATTGAYYNTAIGYEAGDSYDNGYNNVFVGANVDVNGAGYYNDIAIGQGTICTDVSQVTMGNGATATYRAYANWSNISDGRFKKNIKQNVPGLAFINKLQPITYTLDATGIDNFLHQSQPLDKQASGEAKALMSKALAAKEKTLYTGFVAQDVEKAAKSLNYDFSGVDAAKNDKDLYGLRYAEFVVPLVKAVQELSAKNDDLQKQIDDLKAMMLAGNNNKATSAASTAVSLTDASLNQNTPNPFSGNTIISYTLPQRANNAQIVISDKSGQTVKTVNITGNGKGSININASTLSAGAYQYSLLVDGKLIATKQMVLAK